MPARTGDKSTKAKAHIVWLAKRLSTKELSEQFQISLKTAQEWITQWETLELNIIREKQYYSIEVTNDNIEKHASNVDFLASEIDSQRSKLETLPKGSAERLKLSDSIVRLMKAYNDNTGLGAVMARFKAEQIEIGKQSVLSAKIPPSKREDQPRTISGPVVPLD